MKVYVLVVGEKYEGYNIQGIFQNKQDAVNAAMSVPASFDGGWQGNEEDGWRNGCDYMDIVEYEVE